MSLQERMADLVLSGPHQTTAEERDRAGIRPTGQEVFDSLSVAEQDEVLGPAAAEKVRKGEATLEDFVERTSPGDTPGFIRQKPVEDV